MATSSQQNLHHVDGRDHLVVILLLITHAMSITIR